MRGAARVYHAEMTNEAPILNLSSLLRAPGDVSVRGEVTELKYEQGGEQHTLKFAHPAPYRLDVNTIGGDDMWLAGRFQPVLALECARCLRPVEAPVDIKLGTIMRYVPSVDEPHLEEADTGEELLVFGEPQVDLSALLAEHTLISSPLSVLHDPNCKGLCMVCGTDLNESTCEHAAVVPVADTDEHLHAAADSPFAALRGLDLPEE